MAHPAPLRSARRFTLLCVLLPALLAGSDVQAWNSDESGAGKDDRWTLERIFPEKSFFGPEATQPAFSYDGRYAAWLWRPWIERRHGQDLWLLDTESGEVRRLTSVSVMSPFQEATRKVAEDRRAGMKRRASSAEAASETEDAADDGVSGDWSGKLSGAADAGLGADTIDFLMTLRVAAGHAPGRSVEGTMRLGEHSTTITEGSLRENNHLLCTITDPETGLTGQLDVRIENGAMTGTLAIPGLDATLTVNGTRTRAAAGSRRNDDQKNNRNDVDHVDESDAEKEKAPRYGGIQSFEFSPTDNELLFVSAGDLYRMQLPEGDIERLTKTSDPVRSAAWLPDGRGFTFLRTNRLFRVRFGDHRIEQISPDLATDVTLSSYRLSPCGSRLAMLATSGTNMWSAGVEVNIVSYRERFAGVRRVRRHMPDGTIPEFNWHWYVHDLDGTFTERTQPVRVASHRMSGSRDIATTPNWSEDSSRFAFAIFEQSTSQVSIMEVRIPPRPQSPNGIDPEAPRRDNGIAAKNTSTADDAPETQAQLIYRFMHHGGPNTPRMIDPLYTGDHHHLVFLTELSGFRHLHRLDPLYEHLEQLTRGRFEVYPVGMSRDRTQLFALTTRTHPADQVLDRIDVATGELTAVSHGEGFHDRAAISPCGTRALAMHRTFGVPPELYLFDLESSSSRAMTDSHPPEAHALTKHAPEYFTYHNRHGHEIHGHMFLPPGFDGNGSHPLLIYVYGGPLGTRKMISRGAYAAPSYFFARYMAETHGYIAVTIDPRGASGFGGVFEKANFEQVGRPQAEDLVDGARWMVEHYAVDPDRVALHGWSFGGFQTQMCLYTQPGVFACGIAGAGPTEWENYNTWYTTGTIGPAAGGKVVHDRFSLLPLAANLQDRLLLVHGVEDSNVLYQDTMRVYRELLKAGKETLVELFLDPTGGHGLGGDVKTIGRYRKYEAFLLQCIGSDAPAAEAAPERGADAADAQAESDTTEMGESTGGLIDIIRRHQRERKEPRPRRE